LGEEIRRSVGGRGREMDEEEKKGMKRRWKQFTYCSYWYNLEID
jgi:hypothetical protein